MNITTAVPWPLIPAGAIVGMHGRWYEVRESFQPDTGRVFLTEYLPTGSAWWTGWVPVDPAQCPPMLVPTHDEAVAVLRAAGWEVEVPDALAAALEIMKGGVHSGPATG